MIIWMDAEKAFGKLKPLHDESPVETRDTAGL